ncbi:MAG TPA: hypothetical protein VJB59_03765 [Bdellovibrionota bacterium]|nr:hypothetical protein [Bdellovibrionota bacterium]
MLSPKTPQAQVTLLLSLVLAALPVSGCKKTFTSPEKAVVVAYESLRADTSKKDELFLKTLEPGSEIFRRYSLPAEREGLRQRLSEYTQLVLENSKTLSQIVTPDKTMGYSKHQVWVSGETPNARPVFGMPPGWERVLRADVSCTTWFQPEACGGRNPNYPDMSIPGFPSDYPYADNPRDVGIHPMPGGAGGNPNSYPPGQNLPACRLDWVECYITKIEL